MEKRYEVTGETEVDHAKANKIRGITGCYDTALDKETFESLTSFVRARSVGSISFNAELEGHTELFTLYRFINDDGKRVNMFVYTDLNKYEEILSMNIIGTNGQHVNIQTVESHGYSFYPVDDIERWKISYLIDHIMERLVKLNNMMEDKESKDITEVVFDYMRMMKERYK